MSLTEFTDNNNGTRPIEAGDTPDIQDDYGVSVPLETTFRVKGSICQMVAGVARLALAIDVLNPISPVVTTEAKDGTPGNVEVRVVGAGQIVALIAQGGPFSVGQYAGIGSGNGDIFPILEGAPNTTTRKYARYIGKEGAIFERKGTADFDETLGAGIVPDQNLLAGETGWFELVESAF